MKQPEWTHKAGMVATFVVFALILLFSLEPSTDVPSVSWIPFADKGAHFLAYGAFGGSLALWFFRPEKKGKRFLFALSLVILLGALLELLQPSFGRSKELLDLLADSLGGLMGLGAVALFFR